MKKNEKSSLRLLGWQIKCEEWVMNQVERFLFLLTTKILN